MIGKRSSDSAAESLRQALQIAERDEQVLGVFDDFSFGPISTGGEVDRARWVKEVLGYCGWQEVVDETTQSLEVARSSDFRIIAWVSFNYVRSYAGFLWWLSQTEQLPCFVMNVPSSSLYYAEDITELLGSEESLTAKERARRVAQWRILQSEDAPLRIIVGDHLISAPLSEFDASLIAVATTDWQPMAKIVGRVLGNFIEEDVHQAEAFFLASRLADLVEAGVLERRGDMSQMRGCQLRLAS
ncbi:DUF3658 domain-containing protein [Sphingomonas sp. WG]|uniref:DUF3658 domain-containing protein n=1 Tax=Sphingomonas sp. WG TaxID=1592629 RepID=UPI0009EA741F|nr:DUF3658 domain-containing protein [Sphingomonas sp. WG]